MISAGSRLPARSACPIGGLGPEKELPIAGKPLHQAALAAHVRRARGRLSEARRQRIADGADNLGVARHRSLSGSPRTG
jgi:hypothetical protein